MDKAVSSSLGMLLGLLLAVAGIVLIFVTGFDVLIGSLGLLLVCGGVGLTVFFRRRSPVVESTPDAAAGQRSVQRPASESQKRSVPKIDRKI